VPRLGRLTGTRVLSGLACPLRRASLGGHLCREGPGRSEGGGSSGSSALGTWSSGEARRRESAVRPGHLTARTRKLTSRRCVGSRSMSTSRFKQRLVGVTAAAALSVGFGVAGAAPASAESTVWDRVAQCESGGNWHITGNGYYGGLQFSYSTWRAYGGGAYASTANRATKAQKIAIARPHSCWPGPRYLASLRPSRRTDKCEWQRQQPRHTGRQSGVHR